MKTAVLLLALIVALQVPAVRADSIFDDVSVAPARPNSPTPVKPLDPAVPVKPPILPISPPKPPLVDIAPPRPPTVPIIRMAIPPKAELTRSRKLFKDVFSKELADVSTSSRRTLAVRLLAEADRAADNRADQYA